MASGVTLAPILPRAWYQATIEEFVCADRLAVLGSLTANSEFDVTEEQSGAWLTEIDTLQVALQGLRGGIFLELSIPRMGHRADAVVIIGAAAFVLEFKDSSTYIRQGEIQAWDYTLDLKNFHRSSHSIRLVPVLVAPGASENWPPAPDFASDGVAAPCAVDGTSLGRLLRAWTPAIEGEGIDLEEWGAGPYHPTPTIVDAVRLLYAGHQVKEIANSEAGGESLQRTTDRLAAIAISSRKRLRKSICFVTGVPGAGKTLVGLDLATRTWPDTDSHAVFLSGNGPLVAVLRTALERDVRARTGRHRGIKQEVTAFIQLLHHVRDEQLRNSAPPPEHILIYDEAQRAWNQAKLALFMKQRKHRPNFSQSEPETFLQYADRHSDWVTVICLVGSGQEIHTGEAGIGLWLETVADRYPSWDVYVPPALQDREYAATDGLQKLAGRTHLVEDDALHLAVSVRSFRAERLSEFVDALLRCDVGSARAGWAGLAGRFPVVLTRSLDAAKRWVQQKSRGQERYGLLASSRAVRLKPHAIDVRVDVNPAYWFLNGPDDVRSSFFLEDAATEFDVQGLELDWTCVTWDGDLRYRGTGWTHHDFRGTAWNNIHDDSRQAYVRNAYRVLLTRARQGMAIFVPPGDSGDHTRLPAFYDATFNYLASLGLPVMS